MSFIQNIERTITVEAGKNGVVGLDSINNYLFGTISANVISDFGRIFFAGMMYDRFRFRSVFVFVCLKVMPFVVGVFNYTFYFVWDRYSYDLTPAEVTANPRVVIDDLSAKMIVWSFGGNVFALTYRVYFTYKDCYQYIGIDYYFFTGGDPAYWYIIGGFTNFIFFAPIFCYVFDVGFFVGSFLFVNFIFQYRYTIEFMGVASMGYGADAPLSGCSFGLMPLAPVDEDPEA